MSEGHITSLCTILQTTYYDNVTWWPMSMNYNSYFCDTVDYKMGFISTYVLCIRAHAGRRHHGVSDNSQEAIKGWMIKDLLFLQG